MLRWLLGMSRLERREGVGEGLALTVRLFVRSIEAAVLLKVQCLVDHKVFVRQVLVLWKMMVAEFVVAMRALVTS